MGNRDCPLIQPVGKMISDQWGRELAMCGWQEGALTLPAAWGQCRVGQVGAAVLRDHS